MIDLLRVEQTIEHKSFNNNNQLMKIYGSKHPECYC